MRHTCVNACKNVAAHVKHLYHCIVVKIVHVSMMTCNDPILARRTRAPWSYLCVVAGGSPY